MESSTSKNQLAALLSPSSVAIVGSGHGLSRLVLRHVVEASFPGKVITVGAHWTEQPGVSRVERPAALPFPVDLAVIVLGRGEVFDALEALSRRGLGAAVVVSAGFSEVGDAGRAKQDELVALARRRGFRLLGPNCMGVINTAPEVRLHAAFGKAPAPVGSCALITQSGSIGDYFLYHGERWGLGLSLMASVGNEADVTLGELLLAAAEDVRTRVVACYVEHPRDPRAFVSSVRRVASRKPIVLLRGGKTKEGSAAATSHTGRLVSADQGEAVDALLAGAGAVLVGTIEELLLASVALVRTPDGTGPRVAIVTNAGGPGVLAIDSAEGTACQVAPAREMVADGAPGVGRDFASTDGVAFDLSASAAPEHFSQACEAARPHVDSLLALIMSPEGTDPAPIVEALLRSWDGPLSLALLARGEAVERAWSFARDAGLPTAREPALALRALDVLVRRRAARRGLSSAPPRYDLSAALALLEGAYQRGRRRLTLPEGLALCRALGVPVADFSVVRDARGAAEAAGRLGWPVIVKIDEGSGHKSDLGLVSGPLTSPGQVRDFVASALERLDRHPDRAVQGIIVQEVLEGVELMVGQVRHAWGDLLTVGFGGVGVEAFGDVALLAAPVTPGAVERALRGLRGARWLESYRGMPEVSLESYCAAASRLGSLASATPFVYEMEINPFIVPRGDGRGGGGAVDVEVVLSDQGPRSSERP